MRAWCQATARFADWKPYTNERTKKSGWVSAGGQVRYDDPRKQEAEKAKKRATAKDAFEATRTGKIGPEHIEAMKEHLNSLTRDQKRELARSVKAHVGGLKSHLVDRLLAYAQGKEQPPYPKKPRSQSLVAVIQGYGGIDPQSHDLKTTYKNMREAIQDGIALGVFRKGGNGLDTLAEQMRDDGYISVPDNKHAGEHLLDLLKAGVASKHAQTTSDYDSALAEYERAMQEAEEYAKQQTGKRKGARRSDIEEAVRSGSEAGRASRRTAATDDGSGVSKRDWYKPNTGEEVPFGDRSK